MRAAYPARVWALFETLPGAGTLAPGPGVASGRGGSRREGGEIEVWLAVSGGQVREARFRAWGCPWTLALAAAGVARLPGRPVASLKDWSAPELVTEFDLPPSRWGIRLWLEDAVRAAARQIPEGQDP